VGKVKAKTAISTYFCDFSLVFGGFCLFLPGFAGFDGGGRAEKLSLRMPL
jgi:hypothetical protein